MRRWFGLPDDLEHVVGDTFRYHGGVFSLYRCGRSWGCMEVTDLPAHAGTSCALCHEAGWLHLSRRMTLRHVCRDIDKENARHEQRQRHALERQLARSTDA